MWWQSNKKYGKKNALHVKMAESYWVQMGSLHIGWSVICEDCMNYGKHTVEISLYWLRMKHNKMTSISHMHSLPEPVYVIFRRLNWVTILVHWHYEMIISSVECNWRIGNPLICTIFIHFYRHVVHSCSVSVLFIASSLIPTQFHLIFWEFFYD